MVRTLALVDSVIIPEFTLGLQPEIHVPARRLAGLFPKLTCASPDFFLSVSESATSARHEPL